MMNFHSFLHSLVGMLSTDLLMSLARLERLAVNNSIFEKGRRMNHIPVVVELVAVAAGTFTLGMEIPPSPSRMTNLEPQRSLLQGRSKERRGSKLASRRGLFDLLLFWNYTLSGLVTAMS